MGDAGKLPGSRTRENLRRAFAACSQANRRCLYVARVADAEGLPEVGALLRELALAETGHAFACLDRLGEADDPSAALAREAGEHAGLFPELAKAAREEGFAGVAEQFEALARAAPLQAQRLRGALEKLKRR